MFISNQCKPLIGQIKSCPICVQNRQERLDSWKYQIYDFWKSYPTSNGVCSVDTLFSTPESIRIDVRFWKSYPISKGVFRIETLCTTPTSVRCATSESRTLPVIEYLVLTHCARLLKVSDVRLLKVVPYQLYSNGVCARLLKVSVLRLLKVVSYQ